MERLTQEDWKKKSQGGIPWSVHPVYHIDDLPYYKRLAAYEDTGFTPEQVVEMAKELAEYKKFGYTPEELQICFKPPEEIWILDDGSEGEPTNIYRVYPVDGEQIMFCNGDVYWNCRDEYGDYHEIPLSGLNEEYFLTKEEAEAKLKEMEG